MTGAKSDYIRLLISDVDGTLVRDDKSLSDGVVDAVRGLRADGMMVSLISARPPSGLKRIVERLGLDGPIGAFNGGTILKPNGGIVTAQRLTRDAAETTLRLLDRLGVTPWLFADGKWFAKTTDNPHVPHERKAADAEPVLDVDFATLLDRVDKLVGVSDERDMLAGLETEVAAAIGTEATVARSQPYYLDVTAPRANKGDGIAALAEAYGVPLSAVAVFGDQRNDLPMFARAAMSVAMGQGPDEVRAAATHVARSNQEDGVADAIARFLRPRMKSQ